MWQAPSLQCNSADCAIYATTPCALHPGRSLVQTLLWLLTEPPGNPLFPLTTCHRPQPPTRRGVRALAPPPAQDRFSPSSSERHPMLRHCGPAERLRSIRVDRDVGNAIRTLLARGPLCDLHNARSGSVKLGQMTRATLCSCTARAAGFCHPCFGSTGFSSSSCPGRNPAKTASHGGTTNCDSLNMFAHSRTATKLGPGWWDRSVTIVSATSGCLRFTLGMQSAQLPSAQPLHYLMPNTTPILPNSLGLQLPFSRVLNLRRCPPTDRNTSTPRRHGLGRTPQTNEVSPSGGGNWLGGLRKTVTRAKHSEDLFFLRRKVKWQSRQIRPP